MSALEPTGEKELVVAEDGSIPADQLASLGLRPGAHLRVVAADGPSVAPSGLAGSLPYFPDIDWDAFEQASDLARQIVTAMPTASHRIELVLDPLRLARGSTLPQEASNHGRPSV